MVHHASSKKRTSSLKQDPEFSEESLQKARKILNGMIETAQVELDAKTIECVEFRNRNRGQLEQVVADIARLTAQISNWERIKSESKTAMDEIAIAIEKLEQKRGEAEKAYLDQLAIDT